MTKRELLEFREYLTERLSMMELYLQCNDSGFSLKSVNYERTQLLKELKRVDKLIKKEPQND